MKQRFRLLTLAVALMAGLTMTSCLGGDSDYQSTQSAIAKVVPNYTSGAMYKFVAAGGKFTIIPSAAAENSFVNNVGNGFTMDKLNGTIVQLVYYWNPEDPNVEITETSIDNVNFTLQSLDYPAKVVLAEDQNTPSDSVATHPLITLNPSVYGSTAKPFFFDDTKSDIVVPINYYYPGNVRSSASMTLVYYPDDAATKADKEKNILRLYLNYRVLDSKKEAVEFSTQYSGSGYFAYNLQRSGILSRWGSSTPEKVIITTKVNPYSTKLDDTQTEYQDFEVLTVDEVNAQ